MRPAEDVCVLLRGDGQYHLERLFANRTDIFEGSMSSVELQELRHVLDSDELFQLKQEKINNPLINYEFDQLLVGVLRPGYRQNLRFPGPESRQPYRQSLDPLLKWLDSLHKEKHIQLSDEAGRNNCLPPQKIELKTRPAETAAPPVASSTQGASHQVLGQSAAVAFILRIMADHFSDGRMEKSCLVIYPEGGYHREISVQRPGSVVVTTSIFEDSLGNPELLDLNSSLMGLSCRTDSRPIRRRASRFANWK